MQTYELEEYLGLLKLEAAQLKGAVWQVAEMKEYLTHIRVNTIL
jgi:hypothetical protein